MNHSPDDDEPWLPPDLAERLLDGEDITEIAGSAGSGESAEVAGTTDGAGIPETGAAAASDPRLAGLARLLAAADGTLTGRAEDERAVLRAFAQEFGAAPAGVRGGAPVRGLRRTIPRSRAAKVLAGGAAAVFVLGGVAIAAQTGALPRPFHSGGSTPSSGASTVTVTFSTSPAPGSAPETRGTPSPAATTAGAVSLSPTPASSPRPPTPSAHTTGAPAVPGAKGLCQSYIKASGKGRKLDTPSQARLEQAAGGAGKVDAYCAALTGTPVTHGKATTTKSPKPHSTEHGKSAENHAAS